MSDIASRRLVLPGSFGAGIVKDEQGRCWKLQSVTNNQDDPLDSTEGLKSEEGFVCCELCGPVTRIEQIVFNVRDDVELPEFTIED